MQAQNCEIAYKGEFQLTIHRSFLEHSSWILCSVSRLHEYGVQCLFFMNIAFSVSSWVLCSVSLLKLVEEFRNVSVHLQKVTKITNTNFVTWKLISNKLKIKTYETLCNYVCFLSTIWLWICLIKGWLIWDVIYLCKRWSFMHWIHACMGHARTWNCRAWKHMKLCMLVWIRDAEGILVNILYVIRPT